VRNLDTSALYLRDLGFLLRERALKAKRDSDCARGREEKAYAIGRLMAFHEVISLMQQQALSFGLEASDIHLENLDPERDLL
jgi:hypothetical protein